MRKSTLLKTMLLLCALVAGSSSVWAEDILNEPFNIDGTGEVSSSYNGWTVTRCWGGDGSIRLGASSGDKGQLITPALSKLSGGATLTFEVKRYGTDTGSIGISVAEGSGSVSGDVSVASSSISADSWTTKTVTISGGGSTTKIKFLMTNKRMYLRNVKIVPLTTVNVTGVTLNKTSLELEAGQSETLTATIAPSNATNKNVSWKSSDDDIATVSNAGAVTAVAVGTATITVTTEDGSKTATCDITVKPASPVAAMLDLSSNTNWGFPTNKTVDENTYTNTYSIKLKGSTGEGYYFDSTGNNLLLGKEGATLTLPAFAFNVSKIKVYGTEGASASVKFNIYVGDDAVSTEATSSKVTHDFAIAANKQTAGTVYVIKVTNANNMRISKIEIFGYISTTITSADYATFCGGVNALDFSETGITAYTAALEGTSVKLTAISDGIVPANTGVILYKDVDTNTEITVPVTSTTATISDNELVGVSEDTNVAYSDGGKYNYILQMDGTKPAFFKATGKKIRANRAYLSTTYDVTTANAPALSVIIDGENGNSETTEISQIANSQEPTTNGQYYNLNGQRVAQPTKGLYIVNGKKIVVK